MTDMTNIFVTHKRASFRIFAAAALLFAVLLIFAAPASAEVDVWNGTIASGFASGNGSESEPYIIKTGEQLAYLAEVINNKTITAAKYYKLESDIDLANFNWTPIGGHEDSGATECNITFTGTFDGNNHTIYNLTFNNTSKIYVGLFGGSKGTVKNLNIQNAEVIGYSYIGGITGYNYNGNIENCTVTNATIKDNCNVGTTESTNTFTISNSGGITGCNYYYGNIENCTVTNTTIMGLGGSYGSGGITGYNSGSCIENCTVTNTKITAMCSAGGIAGYMFYIYASGVPSTISGCMVENVSIYLKGVAKSVGNFGGIIGYSYGLEKYYYIITDCCVSNVEINGYKCGGVAGFIIYTNITNCMVDNLIINGTGNLGGIAGSNNKNELIENCMVAGLNITSSGNSVDAGGVDAGGIIGATIGNLNITNCVVTGCINSGNYNYVGGVSGQPYRCYLTIENCFVLLSEMAEGTGDTHYISSSNIKGTVTNAYVTLKNNTVWVGLSDEPMETDAETNTTYAYAEDFIAKYYFFSTLGDKWGSKSGYPIPVLTDHPTPKSKPIYLYTGIKLDYVANGGSGEAPTSNHTYYAVNEPERLDTGSSLSKDGYTFTGWNTKKDGTGVSYKKGDVIKLTGDVTLYAQYTQNAGYLLVLPESITLIQKSNGYAEATENISLRITVNNTHAQNLTVSVKSKNRWNLTNSTDIIAYTLNVTDWQNNIHNSSASLDTMSGILTLYPNTLTEELNSEYNSTLYFKTSAPPQFGKTFTDTLTFTVESETIQRTSVST